MEKMRKVDLRAYKDEDARAIVDAHAELYGQEHGYDESFREFVDERVRGIAERKDSHEGIWVLESGGRHLGSICINKADEASAQLGLFLIHPDARGGGYGRELIRTALEFCRDHGYARIILWTNRDLFRARALYASFGFALKETRVAVHSGRELAEELWELEL
ncbi:MULTISPECIES: GNAT family N-acetyltransferase [unclassified Paenibacillus]|uniref:GNAT family N-acetyltransferase n=1 Tax=unclassified Paenibacillus TaxID=185978 RepID=UPI002E1245CD